MRRRVILILVILVGVLIIGVVLTSSAQDQIVLDGETIPVVRDARLMGAFNAQNNPAGRTNIRIYHVDKTVSQAAAYYQNYLRNNNWQVMGGQAGPHLYNASAVKGSVRITIQIVPHRSDFKDCEIRFMW